MIYTLTYNSDTQQKEMKPGTPGSYFARIHNVTENTSIPNATWTNIPFNSNSNTDNFTLSANTVKPLVAGTYAVQFAFYTSNQAIGMIKIRLNHTDRIDAIGLCSNNAEDNASGMSLFYFDGVNDTVSLQVFHGNGASRSIFMTGTEYYCYMNLIRVGD